MMMKSIKYTFVIGVLMVMGCQGNGDKVSDNTSHLGSWEMVYFQSINGIDTTEIVSDGDPLAITLLTPTHFSYQWRNSANSGAGTYTYDGKIIHQEFTYVQDSIFAGSVLSFNMEIQNDSLVFSGPVKAVSPSGEDILKYIPQMREIRRRSN